MNYVDLHCHLIPDVDDGARGEDESGALTKGLFELGFSHAVTTPHIRSGMFNNTPDGLRQAFVNWNGTEPSVFSTASRADQLMVGLGAENHLDELFIGALRSKTYLLYPNSKAILLELPYEIWPPETERWFFEVATHGLIPVMAHPERYRRIQEQPDRLNALRDSGTVMLVDLMSFVGRYGQSAKRCAETLWELDLIDALATDLHRPSELSQVALSIQTLKDRDPKRLSTLLSTNPMEVLNGTYEL